MILHSVALGMVLAGVQTPDTNVYSMTDVQEKPQVISSPAPGYRTCLQDAGIRGVEGLEFTVDTAGRVEGGSIQVVQSADQVLDSLAVADARGEIFRAARKGGIPVRVRVQQPFSFGVTAPPVEKGDSGVFDLACVDQRPRVLKGPPPNYPEGALAGHQVAVVMTTFVVDSTGHVDRATVAIAEGAGLFRASVKVLLTSHELVFEPGRLMRRPVSTRVSMPVQFHICKQQIDSSQVPSGPSVLPGITVVACPR